MAYYTGAANNFGDLQTALLTACTANGWTLADGILSKGLAFVRPYISSTLTITEGPGLLIEGGTGKSGSGIALLQIAQAHATEMANAQARINEINQRVLAGAGR